MSLTSAMNIAQNALSTTAYQTSVLSRNIAGVNDPNFTRKTANVTTSLNGYATVVSVTRAANQALTNNVLSANSAAATQQALLDGLNQLNGIVTGDQSPATLVGNLTNALQQYAATPSSTPLAQTVLTSANALVTTLNQASTTVQTVRTQADSAMASAVTDMNALLSKFQTLNNIITSATSSGADVTDSLDARDAVLSQLSQYVGITTITAANGGMSIYTDSGVTMFQGTARAVTFTATQPLAAGQTGNAVSIDGVPVTGTSAVMPVKSGKLAGLSQLRDVTAVTFNNQIDEMARSLVTTFAESDQANPATLPTVPGLFTWSGAPAMPNNGLNAGLAGSISVNANVDPNRGGNLTLLRDGGISNPGNTHYTYNTSGGTGYSTRLQQLSDLLSQKQTFDPAAGTDLNDTLGGFAAASVSWVEGTRQAASNQADYQNTLVTQSTTALSNATGVNIDDQMSMMLDLEHSYQASAKLMTTVQDMFSSLLQVVT